jgi:hypothetical protein
MASQARIQGETKGVQIASLEPQRQPSPRREHKLLRAGRHAYAPSRHGIGNPSRRPIVHGEQLYLLRLGSAANRWGATRRVQPARALSPRSIGTNCGVSNRAFVGPIRQRWSDSPGLAANSAPSSGPRGFVGASSARSRLRPRLLAGRSGSSRTKAVEEDVGTQSRARDRLSSSGRAELSPDRRDEPWVRLRSVAARGQLDLSPLSTGGRGNPPRLRATAGGARSCYALPTSAPRARSNTRGGARTDKL